MSSGHSANYADVIPQDLILELCPAEWTDLVTLLDSNELTLDQLGRACKFDGSEADELRSDISGMHDDPADDEKLITEILASWERLRAAFKKATTPTTADVARDRLESQIWGPGLSPTTPIGDGLELFMGHHSQSDDGDCYDEVDGVFFAVGGVYQLTPAGQKFQDRIERKFFVSYG